ncbi:alpha/beta fold hydrolase [Natronomonas gomsonensis]|uniref:haloalkane dehalogenase n=1 Tax=Natronomonas gomsonensis TaxID=1046043 RepID=UPI0020CA3555|nr:haloalkane dehalogenase [Natronomonas gomsonensis]MCY4732379.1 alpha/beta fold hydrolase [Natronomonas gomsonensis]
MTLTTTPEERFEDVPDYDYPHEKVPVTDDGAEMAYVDVEGDGDETFLLMHGEPTWGFLYRKMISTLSEHGRVIVPDMLGLGRSDKYTDPDAYSFDLHYDAFETLLFEELDLSEITLVCQDWGGILGLALAGHNPERFARLVAMNTGVPDGTQEMSDAWHQFADFVENVEELPIGMLIQNATAEELSEEVIAAYEAPFPTEESKACARVLPFLIPHSPDDEGADTMQAAKQRLSEWEKPAFVLFSDSDPITRNARDPLRELIPTASEQPDTWIEGAMHFLQEDKGEEIADEIAAFVERS